MAELLAGTHKALGSISSTKICKPNQATTKTKRTSEGTKPTKAKSAGWCMPIIPATWEAAAGGAQIRGQPRKLVKVLSQRKKCQGCRSLVKLLPGLCKALMSVPSTKEKKKD